MRVVRRENTSSRLDNNFVVGFEELCLLEWHFKEFCSDRTSVFSKSMEEEKLKSYYSPEPFELYSRRQKQQNYSQFLIWKRRICQKLFWRRNLKVTKIICRQLNFSFAQKCPLLVAKKKCFVWAKKISSLAPIFLLSFYLQFKIIIIVPVFCDLFIQQKQQ